MKLRNSIWHGAALLGMCIAGCQETTTTGPVTGPTTPNGAATQGVKKLSVMAAKDQTIEQGETDKVLVTINRDAFNDAVTIRLNDLPAGVECAQPEAVIASGENSVTLELKASDNAAAGDYPVTISATAPGINENVQTFTLKVKAKS